MKRALAAPFCAPDAMRQTLSAQHDIERIVLLDGPAILGWAEWRGIQRPLHLALIGHALQHLVDEGHIPAQPLEPLADVISGAVMQAALAIATAANRKQARRTYGASLTQLLERLVGKA